MLFFKLFLVSIFVLSWDAPKPKNWAPASTGARFLQSSRFRKLLEKIGFGMHFGNPKQSKINEKLRQRHQGFLKTEFLKFFCYFSQYFEKSVPTKGPIILPSNPFRSVFSWSGRTLGLRSATSDDFDELLGGIGWILTWVCMDFWIYVLHYFDPPLVFSDSDLLDPNEPTGPWR